VIQAAVKLRALLRRQWKLLGTDARPEFIDQLQLLCRSQLCHVQRWLRHLDESVAQPGPLPRPPIVCHSIFDSCTGAPLARHDRKTPIASALALDLYTFGKLSFFDCGGTRLFLEENTEPPSESVLYFRVPDIDVAYQELRARWIPFTSPPHLIHRHDDGMEEWMAFFEDLEGRALAIMCQVQPVVPE
jgi:hypothetical protein